MTAAAPPAGIGAELQHILDRIRADGDGPHRGLLTGGGSPVEQVFTSRDRHERYTCDVAGTAVMPWLRLRRAEQLSSELGTPQRFPFPELQQDAADLRWGAWLGLRDGDRKIYAEAPACISEAGKSQLRSTLGRYSVLLESHEYRLRIAAAGQTAHEFYFRALSLQPAQLTALARLAGFDAEPLLDLIEDACHCGANRLPGRQHGFSFALDLNGRPRAFAFFAFARSLFGADQATRRAILELTERRCWNMDAYAAAIDPNPSDPRGPLHGIASFSILRDRSVAFSIGVAR